MLQHWKINALNLNRYVKLYIVINQLIRSDSIWSGPNEMNEITFMKTQPVTWIYFSNCWWIFQHSFFFLSSISFYDSIPYNSRSICSKSISQSNFQFKVKFIEISGPLFHVICTLHLCYTVHSNINSICIGINVFYVVNFFCHFHLFHHVDVDWQRLHIKW